MKTPVIVLAGLCSMALGAEPPKAVPVDPTTLQTTPVGPQPVPGVDSNPALPQRAISSSEQFIVLGGDQALRGQIAIAAEDVKRSLLKLSDDAKDEWKIPVRIYTEGKPGDPVPAQPLRFSLTVSEAGWDFRMRLFTGRGIESGPERDRFDHAILFALLYERALRAMPPAEMDERMLVPPWLVVGLQEAIAWKDHKGDRKIYEALAKNGGLYKLSDLLAVSEDTYNGLDGGLRGAFRGTSGALVLALVDQPQGQESFRQFLADAANFGGDMPVLLKRCFPGLNLSETSLSKWLALKVMELKEPELSESLSIDETDKSLTDALKLHFRDASGIYIEKSLPDVWQELAGLSAQARTEAVKQVQEGLVRLSYRSFPSYRLLLEEYQSILVDILKGRTTKTAAQLAKLSETRTTMKDRAQAARDYMDWFEITRARETSGAFEDYMNLKSKLKYETPVRKSPVSTYLDLMQKTFGRSDPRPGAGR
ncbi:MAG: hypothetical protein QM755_11140 [Luteolibacter sp.]